MSTQSTLFFRFNSIISDVRKEAIDRLHNDDCPENLNDLTQRVDSVEFDLKILLQRCETAKNLIKKIETGKFNKDNCK